jgi:hypothetical protein
MKHFLQNHIRPLLIASAALLLSACGSSGQECGGTTMNYVPKVTILASDSNGNKLDAYEISYQVIINSPTYGHSGPKTISCNSTDECDLQFFGVGDLVITVTKVGYSSTSTKASIQAIGVCGESNVEKLTVILKPLA